MARPTKMTPQVTARVLKFIRNGNYRDVAAKAAGISVRTLRDWLAVGRIGESRPHREFLHAVQAAEAAAEIKQVERVCRASTKDPRMALEWLERKFPQRWGRSRGEMLALKSKLAELEKQIHALLRGEDAPAN